MAEVLFCSTEDIVRKSSMLDGNIDVNKLIPSLHKAQTMRLREIIGTDLYNYYVTAITALINNGTVIPTNHANLLNDYIKPILVHLTLAEFTNEASYTISNSGVFKHVPENSQSLSTKEIGFIVQNERDTAQNYTERFLDHMAFYASANFPEWYSNSNDDVSPLHESFKIDWVL